MRINLFIGAALALGVAAPAAAQDIDTTAPFTGAIDTFGRPNTQTFGQTFTVGGENALNTFTMYLTGDDGGTVNFQAYVYAWDGNRALGNALYSSTARAFTGSPYTSPTAFSFDTGALNLVPGQKYVAFLSTTDVPSLTRSNFAYMPYSGEFGSDAYSGGDFVFTNNSTFAQLTGQDWDFNGGVFGDVHFKADFSPGISPVPEPAAWAMLIGGFGMVGGAMRVRARKGRTAAA